MAAPVVPVAAIEDFVRGDIYAPDKFEDGKKGVMLFHYYKLLSEGKTLRAKGGAEPLEIFVRKYLLENICLQILKCIQMKS
jgi:hypothetical protein